MKIEKKLRKTNPKPFVGYTVKIKFMHGDADAYTNEKYYFDNDTDLALALKFFDLVGGLSWWDNEDILNFVAKAQDHKEPDMKMIDSLAESYVDYVTKEDIVRLWTMVHDDVVNPVTDVTADNWVARVEDTTITYFDGTDTYDVEVDLMDDEDE